MIIEIILIVFASIIIGSLAGYFIARSYMKYREKYLVKNMAKKIQSQDKDFIIEGEKVDMQDYKRLEELQRKSVNIIKPGTKDEDKSELPDLVESFGEKKLTKKKGLPIIRRDK